MRRRIGVTLVAIWVAAVQPAAAAMSTEERLQALENLVREQQEEIRQLRGELRQQKAIGTATRQQAERAEEQAKATEKKATATEKRATAALPEWVSKFTPFGDLRIRQEGFYNQPTSTKPGGAPVHANNRTRYRWRIGLRYAYSDELSATVRLSSGNPNDPISTNETFNGDFSRKNANLDWAFLSITPGKTFGIRPGLVNFTQGKFPNPMFRVDEMVFDDDLSPEGFSQTLTLLEQPVGALDQLRVYGQEWTYNNVSNAGDGWMLGGQVNPLGHVGDLQLEAGLGQYYYLNADGIATAANGNSALVITNSVNTTTSGGKTTINGFRGSFNETNFAVAATLANVAGSTLPLRLFGDYVYNWQAPDADAHGVTGGVRLGNPKEQGDWAAGLLYEYLQRNSTVSAFAWSDFGNGGTNLYGPVVALDYQLFKPLTLTARSYFTKYIDTPADTNNRMQVRLQLDALLKF